jgi:hypothetical protein
MSTLPGLSHRHVAYDHAYPALQRTVELAE